MIKRSVLFGALLLSSLFGFSQRDTLMFNCMEMAATTELAAYDNNVNFVGYGLRFTFPLGNRFGLNYKLLIRHNTERDFFLHGNMGSYVSLLLLASGGSFQNAGYLAFVLLVIPEGACYNAVINKNFRITTFINPLGIDYWHDKYTQKDYVKGSLDLGIQPTFVMFDRLTVAPSFGYKLLYSQSAEKGLCLGINIGYRFKEKY